MGECRIGALSRAIVANSNLQQQSNVVTEAQQADGVRRPIICPKPRLGPLRFDGTSEDVSRLDSRRSDTNDVEPGIAELRKLLEAEWSQETNSSVSMLGVSPPVRSGAANPLAHSSSWTASASALQCKSNLKALHELRMKQQSPVVSCPGDYRLLVASPHESGLLCPAADERIQASPPPFVNYGRRYATTSNQGGRCSPNHWAAASASPPEAKILGY